MNTTLDTRRDVGVTPPEPRAPRWLLVAVIALAGLAVCIVGILIGLTVGNDTETEDSTTTASSSTASTDTTVDTTATTGSDSSAVTTATSGVPSTTDPSTTASSGSTVVPTLEQPAVWPAPGVVFRDPTEAAADLVTNVFKVTPRLGPFQQGDSRSGEIEVLAPSETGSSAPVRSVLLLRQLGPDDGWFVLASVNDTTTITTPESRSEVPAGPVQVAGEGRGFEGLLVVEAYVAGDQSRRLDQEITQGGSAESPEPYAVTLDLSGAEPGETVLLLVRGGVGLETDTGEFSAIPVVIAS